MVQKRILMHVTINLLKMFNKDEKLHVEIVGIILKY